MQKFAERLEDRVLFSYTFGYGGANGPQTVNESGGSDSFTVINNGFGLLEWSTDHGATFSAQWGAIPADTLNASPAVTLTINQTGDNSDVIVGQSIIGSTATASASAVQARLVLNPNPGLNGSKLTIDDSRSSLGNGAYAVSTSGVATTIIGPLNDINVTSNLGMTGGATIVGDTADNVFNVASTSPFQSMSIVAGSGASTVNIGSSSAVGGILSPVSVTSPTGTATLNIDDSADTTSSTATLSGTTPYEVTGLSIGAIEYGAGVTAVNITGGTFGGSGVTFDVNNTQAITTTTITGGANQNSFNLANASESGGLDNLPGPVVVQGGASIADAVTLNDSSADFNDTYTVTSTTVSRIVFGGLTYDDNIRTLTLNAENTLSSTPLTGNNTININSTADFVTTNVSGQGGHDTVNINNTGSSGTLNVTAGTDAGTTLNVVADNEPVNLTLDSLGTDAINIGSTGGAGTMAGILSPIDIIDTPGFFTLSFNDQNDATSRTWTLDNNDTNGILGLATMALSGGIATTTYRPGDLSSPMAVNGGSGGNTFNVNNTTSLATTTLNTGTGNDTVNVSATGANALNINGVAGQDTVTLGGLAAVGMQNLSGTIHISNSLGFSTLILDDSQDGTGQIASLVDNGTTGTMTGLAPASIIYTDNDTTALNILGGSGGNTFNVAGTLANQFIPNTVTILNKGAGAHNTVNVSATNASSVLNLTGTGLQDTVNVSSAGSVTGIEGSIYVNEAPGSTKLVVDASADVLSHNLELSSDGTTSTLHDQSGNLPADITYNTASLTSLTLDTGAGSLQLLNVNFDGGGNPIPAGGSPGLVFNAGDPTAGLHILAITGQLPTGPFASETHNANDPAVVSTVGQKGSVAFDDGTALATAHTGLWYSGVFATLDAASAANYTFNDFANDNSFTATNNLSGPGVIGTAVPNTQNPFLPDLNAIVFQNTPTTGPATFATTAIANKTNVTFNTTALVGMSGHVDIATPSTGLSSLTFRTLTNAENDVTFANTPAGVVTSLTGGTDQDTTNVTGAGVSAGTVLFLTGGAGVDTLNYNAGGENPTVTPGLSHGEVLISVPGSGTVDAIGYENMNVTNVAPVTIIPGAARTLNTVSGFNLTDVVVGSFTLPPPAIGTPPSGLPTSDFTASIDWGDASSTAGKIIQDANNPSLYYITGTHAFAADGYFTVANTVAFSGAAYSSTVNGVSVSVTLPPAVATAGTSASAVVTQGPLAVSVFPIVGTAGTPIPAGPIATVVHSGGEEPIGNFSAIISYINSAGTTVLTVPASFITEGAPSQYTVSAPAVSLPAEGTYKVVVTVTDMGNTFTQMASGAALAVIADAPLTAGQPASLAANTGITFTNISVGAFTDGDPIGQVGDFTATVNWGDGLSSPATITQPGGVGTPFSITGSHAFAKPGNYTTQISVTDAGGATITLQATAIVTDLPVYGSTKSFTAVAGLNSGQFVLATFEDPNTLATVSDVNAKVAIGGWGDGTPGFSGVQLVVQQTGVDPSTGDPIFQVLGSHTYAQVTPPGLPDTLSVIITTLGGATTTLTSPPGGGVTVSDAALTGLAGNPITATEGAAPAAFTVATFSDGDPAATTSSFTATVTATSSTGQTVAGTNLVITQLGSGTFAVTTALAFPDEGNWTIATVVSDQHGNHALIGTTASIADARLTAGIAVDLTPNTGALLSANTVVGTFTDANPAAPAGDFTAVINWGDGSPTTVGTVSALGGGAFSVTGSHAYAKAGSYSTQISASDVGGSIATLNGIATVTDLPVTDTIPTVAPITATGLPGSDVYLSPLSTAASTDGGTLSFSVLNPPALGSVSIVTVGGVQEFLYHPGPGAFTTDAFTYLVTDSKGATNSTTATVNYVGAGTVASSLNSGRTDLVVVGSSGNHTITFTNTAGFKKVRVTIDGQVQGTYVVTGRVFGFAQDGNDIFNAAAINKSLLFYGGTGNNSFIGGSAGDVFVGGTGNDALNGRGGRNLLIGGGGANMLTGANGTDLLVAGSTIYDAPTFANQAALLQILGAWKTTKNLPIASAAVGAGFGGGATPALNTSTITGDDAGDILTGNTHSWFFGDFTYTGGADVFKDGRHIKPDHFLTPLKNERVTQI